MAQASELACLLAALLVVAATPISAESLCTQDSDCGEGEKCVESSGNFCKCPDTKGFDEGTSACVDGGSGSVLTVECTAGNTSDACVTAKALETCNADGKCQCSGGQFIDSAGAKCLVQFTKTGCSSADDCGTFAGSTCEKQLTCMLPTDQGAVAETPTGNQTMKPAEVNDTSVRQSTGTGDRPFPPYLLAVNAAVIVTMVIMAGGGY